MPEEVLFEDERRQTRAEIAGALRSVADKLEAGEPITLTAGGQSVTVDPPEQPTFEIKVERETNGAAETGELSIEFEVEWAEGDASEPGDLSIE